MPVIVLSGRSGETDRIIGLDLGADDYLVKPFSPGELAARVRSVLRRATPVFPTTAARRTGLCVDARTREVTVNGGPSTSRPRSSTCSSSSRATPARCSAAPSSSSTCGAVRPGWQGEATVTEHVHRLRHKLERGEARVPADRARRRLPVGALMTDTVLPADPARLTSTTPTASASCTARPGSWS